jgi:hypothetical protein
LNTIETALINADEVLYLNKHCPDLLASFELFIEKWKQALGTSKSIVKEKNVAVRRKENDAALSWMKRGKNGEERKVDAFDDEEEDEDTDDFDVDGGRFGDDAGK